MKSGLTISIACVLFFACSNNKAAQENTIAESKQKTAIVSSTETHQLSGDGIVGSWKLVLECYDDNGNKTPDEDEKKKGIKNRYLVRFNADGSCLIQEVYKGRYDVKNEGSKKMLYVYRNRVVGQEEKDPPPDIYHIISQNKNELILLENEGNLVFWVFERQ